MIALRMRVEEWAADCTEHERVAGLAGGKTTEVLEPLPVEARNETGDTGEGVEGSEGSGEVWRRD